MEIDITRFFAEADAFEFSRSIAEAGQDAGPSSWRNAMGEAADRPLLATAAQVSALRDYAQGFGAWEPEEIAAWSPEECNALFIQMVSGDMREGGLDSDPSDAEWAVYEADAECGRCSGRIYRSSDRVYYYLGE